MLRRVKKKIDSIPSTDILAWSPMEMGHQNASNTFRVFCENIHFHDEGGNEWVMNEMEMNEWEGGEWEDDTAKGEMAMLNREDLEWQEIGWRVRQQEQQGGQLMRMAKR